MCLKLKFVFAFGLFIAFNASVESKEFCEAFAENDFKLSYVFNFRQKSEYNLIIKGECWSVELDVEKEKISGFEITSQSKECPLFNDSFFAVTILNIAYHEWPKSVPLLFHKNNWKEVTVGYIPNEDLKRVRELRDYQYLKNLTITGVNLDSSPQLVFAESNRVEKNWRPNRLTLVWKNSDNSLRIERYDMDLSLVGTKTNDQEYIQTLKDLKTTRKVLAIEPHWSDHYNKYGYIFVFEDQKVITWCWSAGDSKGKNWCEKPKTVLADCSKNKPPTPTASVPSTSEPPEGNGIWIWILVVIIVVVVILAILVIVFMCCGNNKSGEEVPVSAVSGVASNSAIQKRSELNAKSAAPSAKPSNKSEVISKK